MQFIGALMLTGRTWCTRGVSNVVNIAAACMARRAQRDHVVCSGLGCPVVFEVLRHTANRRELKNLSFIANLTVPRNHNMALHHDTLAEHDIGPDQTEGTDNAIFSNDSPIFDDA